MSDNLTVLMRVRYGECDAQGVAFNARYADFADIVATEYQRVTVGSIQELHERKVDMQVVKMEIQWSSSANYDEVLALTAETIHVGNTSFSLKIQMRAHETGREVAECNIVYVMVDAKSFLKTPIPNDLRDRLEQGPRPQIIDQSGCASV